MNGHVDSDGRAIVSVSIRPSDVAAAHDIQVWIDTGFNGDLVLPQQQINEFELPPTGTVKAILAEGSEVALQRYACLIARFGEERDLEVVANDGEYPLLAGYDLYISYRSGNVIIE